jgi:hypothetical protein
MRFGAILKNTGGVNKFFAMPVPSSNPDEQFVVRMNRDTPYSVSVIDMSSGNVYVTVPETDRYVTIQIVDENHETQPMIYGPGRHKITAKTDHAFVIVRTLDGNIRHNLIIEAGSAKPFEVKEWDMETFHAVDKAGNIDFSDGYDQSKAFSNTESGQTPYMNYVGAAGGWGGAMVQDNIYQTSQYMSANACYETTFVDPEAKYFWSATVYNGDGRMFNDIANISSEMNPVQNADGTYTLRFGCGGQPNNIPIVEGNTTGKFNVLMRHYGPSKQVSNGEAGYDATKLIHKAKTAVIVTRENYPTVETSRQFVIQIKNAGGINKLNKFDGIAKVDNQPIIRLNQDTAYTMGVVDVSKGATVTIPDAGDRFISVTFIDSDHYVYAAKYGAGTYDFPQDTDYIYVNVRIGSETASAEEDAIIAKLQDKIVVKANSAIPFTPINYDEASFEATHKLLLGEFMTGKHDPKTMFNVKGTVNEEARQVGSAIGWGGGQMVDNIWTMYPDSKDFSCQSTTFENPKNEGGFWSITVYNKDGFLFAKNNINSYRAELNDGGTYTVRFGCEGQANNIDTKTGNDTGTWNAILRAYRPSKLVQSGKWEPLKNVKHVKVDKPVASTTD